MRGLGGHCRRPMGPAKSKGRLRRDHLQARRPAESRPACAGLPNKLKCSSGRRRGLMPRKLAVVRTPSHHPARGRTGHIVKQRSGRGPFLANPRPCCPSRCSRIRSILGCCTRRGGRACSAVAGVQSFLSSVGWCRFRARLAPVSASASRAGCPDCLRR
jgi:hypothetical protein